MAANLQQMAAVGQMMQQQQPRRPHQQTGPMQQLGPVIVQALTNQGPAPMGWQSAVSVSERMGKVVSLYVVTLSPSPPVL